MSNSKQLKIGAIVSYISIFINIGAGLVYTPWMVQQIGKSQYGLYTLANSLIAMFLVDFGLSSATSRYISKYCAEENQEKVNNFLGVIYKLYLAITTAIFVVLLVLYFFIDTIYVRLTPAEISQFKIVYIIAALFSIINFPFVTFNGILISYEKFLHLKLADIIYRVSFVVSTIVALLLGHGLYVLVALHACAGLLIIIYKYVVIKKTIPIKVNFKYSDKSLGKDIFSFSIWVTISSLAQRLIFNITPSILGMVSNSSAIAVFGIVSTIESYVYTIITAINGMFMPRISRIIVEDKNELPPLMLKIGRYLYALNGLIVSGFAVVGDSFIRLWMGEGYSEAYLGILLVLIPGVFYNSLQIANTTMIATKKVNIQAYVNTLTGVVNVILSFFLSRSFGVIGSCVSIFIAYMIRAVVLNMIYHKMNMFGMPNFIKKCYLRMSLPALATIFVTKMIAEFIHGDGWLIFFVKCLIVMTVYLVFVFLLALNRNERKTVIRTVSDRLIKRKA